MPDEDEPPLLELPRTLRVAFSETAATKKHTIIRMVCMKGCYSNFNILQITVYYLSTPST